MNTQLFNVENTGGHAAPTGQASGRPRCILLLPLPSSLPCLDRGLTIVTLALGMPPRQWSHHPCPAPRYHSRLMPPCRRRHRLALVAVMPSLQLRLRYLAPRHPPCCHPTVHSPQPARCPLSATASRPPHPSQLPTRCPLGAHSPQPPHGPLSTVDLWSPCRSRIVAPTLLTASPRPPTCCPLCQWAWWRSHGYATSGVPHGVPICFNFFNKICHLTFIETFNVKTNLPLNKHENSVTNLSY